MKKNFIEKSIQKRHISNLSNEELNNELSDKFEESNAIENEIDSLNAAIESLNHRQNERINALNKETERYVSTLSDSDSEILKEIDRISNEEKEYSRRYQELQADLKGKVDVLVLKRQELIEAEQEGNKKAAEEKAALENRLKDLLASIENQKEEYEARITSLEEELEKAKKQHQADLRKAEASLEAVKEEGSKKAAFLEEKKKAVIDARHEDMESLTRRYEEELKAKKMSLSEVLDSKRNKLNELTDSIDSLKETRDHLLAEYENRKKFVDTEYDNLVRQRNIARENALQNNASLTLELENRRNLLNETVLKDQREYDKQAAELNELIESLKRIEITELAKNKDEFFRVSKELRERYTAYVGQLDEKYAIEKESLEADIEELKALYAQKREELNRQTDSYKEKLNTIRENNKRNLEKRRNELEASKKELETVSATLRENENSAKNEIEQLEGASKEDLKNKKAEYDSIIASKQNEYEKEIRAIDSKLEELNYKIVLLNQEIGDYNKRYSTMENASRTKKENLVRAEEEYLANAKVSEDELKQSIALAEEKFAEEEKEFEQKIKALEDEKAESTRNHALALETINADYAKKIEDAKNQFDLDYEKAQKNNDQKISEIKTEAAQTMSRLTADHEGFELSSEAKRNEISVEIDKLQEDTDTKIANMQLQHSNVLSQIEEIKRKNEVLLRNLKTEKEKMDTEFHATLDAIEKDKSEALSILEKSLTDENSRLNEADNTLSIRKSELDSVRIRYEQEKINRESEISEQEALSESHRKQAENNLEQAKNKLARLVSLNSQKIANYTEELTEKQKINDDYKAQTDEELANLKKDKEELKRSTVADLEAKLKAFIEQCANEEEELRKQCNYEIESKRSELKIKEDALNKLVDAILQRKYTTSANLEAKYQRELEKANNLEEEYEKYSKNFEIERIELTRQIEAQKVRNEENLKALKEDNAALITKKTEEFEALIKAQSEKRKSVEEEIQKVTSEISNTADEYRAHKLKEDLRLDKVKVDTEHYLSEVANQIAGLVSEEYSLNQAHEEKLEKIFAEINAAKEEYEVILKAKPISVQTLEEESTKEIEAHKDEFRNRLINAENAFHLVIKEIETNRNEVLDSISKDIEKVVNGEKDTLDKHEGDIVALSKTYEKMIAEEEHRQVIFTDKLTDKRKTVESFKNEAEGTLSSLNYSFAKETEDLTEKMKDVLESLEKEHQDKSIENLRMQQELDAKLNELNERLTYLNKNYEVYDNQLAEQKRIMVNVYNRKVASIRTAYTKALESQRARFQDVDFMSDDILDIFKRNQA